MLWRPWRFGRRAGRTSAHRRVLARGTARVSILVDAANASDADLRAPTCCRARPPVKAKFTVCLDTDGERQSPARTPPSTSWRPSATSLPISAIPRAPLALRRALRSLTAIFSIWCSWHRRTFGITSEDRAEPYLAGLAFDAAVWELWPHLSAGATVVILADDGIRMSPRHLRGLDRAAKAPSPSASFPPLPRWRSPPVGMELAIGNRAAVSSHGLGRAASLSRRRPALQGCEQLWSHRMRRGGDFRHHHSCGNGVGAAVHRHGHQLIQPIYLLDENLQPVPPGATGEALHRRRHQCRRGYASISRN